MLSRLQAGDTIIEVLFAITVFSMVAVGGLSIMNQGTSAAQRSLETTLVRQQIDAQADLIRYAHAVYINEPQSEGSAAQVWRQVKEQAVSNLAEFGGVDACESEQPGSFVVTRRTEGGQDISLTRTPFVDPAEVYSKVNVNRLPSEPISQGLWVQAVRVPVSGGGATRNDAYDMHIRACWNSPGGNVPSTIGTIVRLYEPAN